MIHIVMCVVAQALDRPQSDSLILIGWNDMGTQVRSMPIETF